MTTTSEQRILRCAKNLGVQYAEATEILKRLDEALAGLRLVKEEGSIIDIYDSIIKDAQSAIDFNLRAYQSQRYSVNF